MSWPDEDIALYARAFYGRYGADSYIMAMEKSAKLVSSGDPEGVAVWRRVAQHIQRLAAADRQDLGISEEYQSLAKTERL